MPKSSAATISTPLKNSQIVNPQTEHPQTENPQTEHLQPSGNAPPVIQSVPPVIPNATATVAPVMSNADHSGRADSAAADVTKGQQSGREGYQPNADLQPSRVKRWIGAIENWLITQFNESIGFMISLVSHVILMLILAIAVVTNQSRPALTFTLQPGLDAAESETFELDDAQAFSADELPDTAPPEVDVEVDIELPEIDLNFDNPIEEAILSTVGELQQDAAAANSMFGGQGEGHDDGVGASFFGVEAGGDRFVFVVDSSTSMLDQRWRKARYELSNSISRLGPTQKYFVICFDYKTHTLFRKEANPDNYVTPSNATNGRVNRWMRGVENGGDTRPADALQMALNMKPDAIYLLSDGEIKDHSMGLLEASNHDPITGEYIIPIHTISLESEYGRLTLEQIAERNGGTFRSIE